MWKLYFLESDSDARNWLVSYSFSLVPALVWKLCLFLHLLLVSLLPQISEGPVVSCFTYVSISSHSIIQYLARQYIPSYTRVMHIYGDLYRARSGGKSRKLPLANSLHWFALSVKLAVVCNVSPISDNYSEYDVFWIVTPFSLVNMRRRFRVIWSTLFILKVVTVVFLTNIHGVVFQCIILLIYMLHRLLGNMIILR